MHDLRSIRCAVGGLLVALRGRRMRRHDDTAPPGGDADRHAEPRPRRALGSPVDMTYRFVVAADAPAFAEDYWVFVHFVDADGEQMWTDDHEPPTPTTAVEAGQTIEYTRTMFVPMFPYVGRGARSRSACYSPQIGRPAAAGRRRRRAARRTGSPRFELLPQTDNLFVVFKDGWHDGRGRRRRLGGRVAVDQEGGDARLPEPEARRRASISSSTARGKAFTGPQQVEVRLGGQVVDSSRSPPDERELRKIRCTAASWATARWSSCSIVVDKTFVPGAGAGAAEQRPARAGRPGVPRVRRAAVEPDTAVRARRPLHGLQSVVNATVSRLHAVLSMSMPNCDDGIPL